MTTTIRIELVLSVEVDSAWGEDCTMGQVYKQGCDDAIARLGRQLQSTNGIKIISIKGAEMTTRVS